jgi:hypothetical protein
MSGGVGAVPQAVHPARLRAAAARAPRVYPREVADVLARELATWAAFGCRFGSGALVARVCDDLLRKPITEEQ